MKHTIILLFLSVLISCSESDNIDSNIQPSQQTEIFNIDKSTFLNQTGYVDLIINKASGEEWKDHYIKTSSELKGHKFLNQYRLNSETVSSGKNSANLFNIKCFVSRLPFVLKLVYISIKKSASDSLIVDRKSLLSIIFVTELSRY